MLYLLCCFLLGCGIAFAKENNKPLKILCSGETHAMLNSCDCQVNPGGGLPKRSKLLKDIRSRNDLLLLDAGGFSGGGLYDTYTEEEAGIQSAR